LAGGQGRGRQSQGRGAGAPDFSRTYPEFLDEAFRTESYRCGITFNADGSWTYLIETELLVKGQASPFNHHDTNTLQRVGAPALNPLAAILKDREEKKK
jgi:hypothetical protein